MVPFSHRGGKVAAGTAVSGTALLPYGMNILTSTPCSDLFIVECVSMMCEAASLLPACFLLYASQKHIHGDYGFNPILTHHISFHWLRKDEV